MAANKRHHQHRINSAVARINKYQRSCGINGAA